MLVAFLSMVVVVGQVDAFEPEAREVVVGRPGPVACATCEGMGMPSPVTDLIVRLQTSPDRHARERAARTLRDVSWRRHPEVPGALAFSLLKDPAKHVRLEAAESLTKMRACGTVVHQALRQAATSDPSLLTRLQARKALRAMNHRCEAACDVCSIGGPGLPIGGTVVETPGVVVEELNPVVPGELDGPAVLESRPSQGGTLEPLPAGTPRDEPAGPFEDLKPKAEPGPALDSSVKPMRDPGTPPPPAEELSPLPDPDAAPRSKPQTNRVVPRPRVAVGRLPSPRVSPWIRPR